MSQGKRTSGLFVLAVVVAIGVFVGSSLLTDSKAAPAMTATASLAKATFAGGCFWCMVHPFDHLRGVVKVTSGYAGGLLKNPTYDQVSAGGTGHREVVEVIYDPRYVTYASLLEVFWHNVDPTNNDGQFCDLGSQYRSAIFYYDEQQHQLALASKAALEKKMKVHTDVLPAGPFYPAEEYHQNYYKKNPIRYRFYRLNCGRDHRLEQLWGADAGQ